MRQSGARSIPSIDLTDDADQPNPPNSSRPQASQQNNQANGFLAQLNGTRPSPRQLTAASLPHAAATRPSMEGPLPGLLPNAPDFGLSQPVPFPGVVGNPGQFQHPWRTPGWIPPAAAGASLTQTGTNVPPHILQAQHQNYFAALLQQSILHEMLQRGQLQLQERQQMSSATTASEPRPSMSNMDLNNRISQTPSRLAAPIAAARAPVTVRNLPMSSFGARPVAQPSVTAQKRPFATAPDQRTAKTAPTGTAIPKHLAGTRHEQSPNGGNTNQRLHVMQHAIQAAQAGPVACLPRATGSAVSTATNETIALSKTFTAAQKPAHQNTGTINTARNNPPPSALRTEESSTSPCTLIPFPKITRDERFPAPRVEGPMDLSYRPTPACENEAVADTNQVPMTHAPTQSTVPLDFKVRPDRQPKEVQQKEAVAGSSRDQKLQPHNQKSDGQQGPKVSLEDQLTMMETMVAICKRSKSRSWQAPPTFNQTTFAPGIVRPASNTSEPSRAADASAIDAHHVGKKARLQDPMHDNNSLAMAARQEAGPSTQPSIIVSGCSGGQAAQQQTSLARHNWSQTPENQEKLQNTSSQTSQKLNFTIHSVNGGSSAAKCTRSGQELLPSTTSSPSTSASQCPDTRVASFTDAGSTGETTKSTKSEEAQIEPEAPIVEGESAEDDELEQSHEHVEASAGIVNLEEVESFAIAFKLWRSASNLSQAQIACALSIAYGQTYGQSAISRFEKCEMNPIDARKFKNILERWMKTRTEAFPSGHDSDVLHARPELNPDRDENLSRRRKTRAYFTQSQTTVLNNKFEENPYPSELEIEAIAAELGHNRDDIRKWFINKRHSLNGNNSKKPRQ